jgi:hypothetical protein
MVAIREPPVPVNIDSYISGTVIEVIPGLGAIIETPATLVQGILGVGGETHGELMIVKDSPEEVLNINDIGPESAGKILVGGAMVTSDAIRKAVGMGTKGIVVGGIEEEDLTKLLGYKIGVGRSGTIFAIS